MFSSERKEGKILLFNQPLADQMRPNNLKEIVGQQALLGKGKPLRQIIEQNYFYGDLLEQENLV